LCVFRKRWDVCCNSRRRTLMILWRRGCERQETSIKEHFTQSNAQECSSLFVPLLSCILTKDTRDSPGMRKTVFLEWWREVKDEGMTWQRGRRKTQRNHTQEDHTSFTSSLLLPRIYPTDFANGSSAPKWIKWKEESGSHGLITHPLVEVNFIHKKWTSTELSSRLVPNVSMVTLEDSRQPKEGLSLSSVWVICRKKRNITVYCLR
jgi:hypothetical protein